MAIGCLLTMNRKAYCTPAVTISVMHQLLPVCISGQGGGGDIGSGGGEDLDVHHRNFWDSENKNPMNKDGLW